MGACSAIWIVPVSPVFLAQPERKSTATSIQASTTDTVFLILLPPVSRANVVRSIPSCTSFFGRACGAVPFCRSLFSVVPCLLYTSDAADDLLCVDLGGRCIIIKK